MSKLHILTLRVDTVPITEQVITLAERNIGAAQGDHLYFVVQSNGGDPAIAVRVITFLQSRFKHIHAVVPMRAMSAATLLALGCDDIYMGAGAMLGPLDIQIQHPIDRSFISSLDMRDSYFKLMGFTDQMATTRLNLLLQNFQLNKQEAAKIAYESANNFVKPMLDQIDPYYLQFSLRIAQIGESYARRLLANRMMKTNPNQAVITAKALAYEYDSHGFAITPQEAKEYLKLKVLDLEALPIWPLIQTAIPPIDPRKSDNDTLYYREIDDVSDNPQQPGDQPAGDSSERH